MTNRKMVKFPLVQKSDSGGDKSKGGKNDPPIRPDQDNGSQEKPFGLKEEAELWLKLAGL